MPKKANEKPRGSFGIRVSGSGRHTDGGFDLGRRVRGQPDRPNYRLAERRSTLRGRADSAFGTWLREVEYRCTEFAQPCDDTRNGL
jgi:hypothetical protein